MAALRIPDIISKKRDGETLTEEEIDFFLKKVVDKSFEGAQLGAMLMAMYLKHLNDAETTALTRAMTHSGIVLTWPDKWKEYIVDKHSTGGVGDKVSLLLVPALAACGMKVPMISGRGLAHTGGTLDKMESIPGFRIQLTHQEMMRILDKVGCIIAGPTDDIVPADNIMYANRDVTGTVNSPGLITRGHALFLCGHVDRVLDGCRMINSVIQDGTAVKKFCAMLKAQGVEPDLADQLCRTGADVRGLLPNSKRTTEVCCQAKGYIHDIDGLKCAEVTCKLGAGRNRTGEAINHAVGLELTKHIGDNAEEGEPWVIVHHDEDKLPVHILDILNQTVVVKSTPRTGPRSRIIDVISG